MCELCSLLPLDHAGALQDPRRRGVPAEVLQRHEQVSQTHHLAPFSPASEPNLAGLFLLRFQGREQCVCGEGGVTQQYSQVRWDSFAVEVLNSLYNTAPVSMHCNQSDARSFPVSPSPTSLSAAQETLNKTGESFLVFCLLV